MTLSVVPLPKGPTVPDLLRQLAEGMDTGIYAMPVAMAYVFESEDGLSAGMIGQTNEIHACGLLCIGAQFLAREATD
jgi:hypothetical protein